MEVKARRETFRALTFLNYDSTLTVSHCDSVTQMFDVTGGFSSFASDMTIMSLSELSVKLLQSLREQGTIPYPGMSKARFL